ncbi:tetratricopeptide repeat protein [Ferrigenium sp. UT5]|uniref:tetratricopeptide repeat protein n=1 Tax=Ferrigenium sp. UT5 TaxID=3242105 RepID=UPI0035540866
MKFSLSPLLLLALLTACAHAPQTPDAAPAAAAGPVRPTLPGPVEPVLPEVALTDRLLYEFLLGDFAAQRGRPELAAQVYLDLARTTRDPRVARRAAQLTFEAHQYASSLEAFRLWQQLEPDSPLAKQMLVSLLLSGGKLAEARPHVTELLASDPQGVGHMFINLYGLLARVADKGAVLDWLVEVAQPYPKVAEAHWAVAQAASAANQPAQALAEAQQAASLRPEWDLAAMLLAQLTQRTRPEQAAALLAAHLEKYPAQQNVRLFRARMLLEQKQYVAAREEFMRLLQQRPGNAEIAFAIAMVSLQLGELQRAEEELRAALAGTSGKKDEDTLHFYLGQLSEARQDEASALIHYRQIREGERHYDAQLRMAYLLHKQGQAAQARTVLQQVLPGNDAQRVQLLLIEAQFLRDDAHYAESFKVLNQGLAKFPAQPELLYRTALAADKLKQYDTFERLIRRLIEVEPDNAHAYNALGYGWLERNVRIAEAMELVQKAHALLPDDAAILDSVGWGYFRLNDLARSIDFLRRAFAANPDPEIAAHLGEVLWVKGERAEAQAVWRASAQAHPDNETLQAVIRKFLP